MAGRRQFLKTITALGAAGLAGRASAARAPYDPAAKFPLKITDLPFRRTEAGRQLSRACISRKARACTFGDVQLCVLLCIPERLALGYV